MRGLGMAQSTSPRRDTVVGAVGLAVLLVSGLVLAVAWLIAVPAPIFIGAAAVALAAMIAVLISGYRAARSSGTGVRSAIGRSMDELRQFCLLFF